MGDDELRDVVRGVVERVRGDDVRRRVVRRKFDVWRVLGRCVWKFDVWWWVWRVWWWDVWWWDVWVVIYGIVWVWWFIVWCVVVDGLVGVYVFFVVRRVFVWEDFFFCRRKYVGVVFFYYVVVVVFRLWWVFVWRDVMYFI